MRSEMWRWLDATFSRGSRLIDLGCGTGLDAVRMAQLGHFVTATDWSPRMVLRTKDRAEREHMANRVQALALGAHELWRMRSKRRALKSANTKPQLLPDATAQQETEV